ncbi:TAXI family TRAP transporter solute-binding subunit [Chachezhania antarctica]|uniref:TAXI family TRAP transporter solute-binding subunit n=1 Tax=Chachezhania antarctica TaxID=2340860 RepID=UPI000EB4C2FC|nr:TAXI family TRAP transporter solute-binding subunit [Chachezhania antarctica]|tara:strand:- start:2166 stop:3194 length:1029 start_codon:yes stop_codon:yes gene_type:complete
MLLRKLKTAALALASGAVLMAGTATADAQTLRMASLGQASPTTVFSIALSQAMKKDYGYSTQLATGSPATRQAVEAAMQQLDLFVTAVSINSYLKNGTRMYEKMDNAPELFSELRSIVNYPLGAYHGIAWADTGINSMADMKGKKVFVGPPSSAGRTVILQVIKGVTGYEPDKDFTPVNLDWASAEQAFQDRQVDVYFVPTPIPSAELQQLSALGEFRVLGIPDDKVDSEGVKAASSVPGREFDFLQPGTYSGQVNEKPVRMVSSIVGLGTNKWMDEEVAYNVTKAVFENHDALVQAAKWMSIITPENALNQMNAPLHVGAYKYYKEIGVDVPEDLIPPEAK